MQKRDAYVARLNQIYARNLDGAQIELAVGVAKFVGPRELRSRRRRVSAGG